MDESPTTTDSKKTIVFFHPDLGIGGAERLVVDAAVGLQNRGHKVVIFTSHCDPSHCFDEVKPKTGVLDVRVRGGDVVPPSVLGRFAILCAIARQLHLLLQVGVVSHELKDLKPTAFFVDQLSAGVPLLGQLGTRLATGTRVPTLFYCHFPDLLLVQGRQRWWKRLYRVPFDALEQWSMGFADAVAVNSKFTRGVVSKTWPRLAAHTDLRVVYPCIDIKGAAAATAAKPWKGMPFLLSINRFERKKDIGLAIRAFAGLPVARRHGCRLVVAGGYDSRVAENVAYHHELNDLAISLGLDTATADTTASALATAANVQVLFLRSVPSDLKTLLLEGSRLLVYTPANEHFGIVPLEAMLAGCPVLACNSGGPTETVVEDETGWLRDGDDIKAWTKVMGRVLPSSAPEDEALTDTQRTAMAAAGRQRVRGQFADVQMAGRLDGILDELEKTAATSPAPSSFPSLTLIALFLLAVQVVIIAVIVKLVFL